MSSASDTSAEIGIPAILGAACIIVGGGAGTAGAITGGADIVISGVGWGTVADIVDTGRVCMGGTATRVAAIGITG